MFLFILDLSIELESVAPIIYKLNRSVKNKVYMCSINFIQSDKKNKTLNFLRAQNIPYDEYPIKNLKYYFWKLFIFFLNIIPKNNFETFRNFFRNLYNNKILFDKNEFEKYLIKKKIHVVTLDTSIPQKKKELIFEVCKKLKIKIIGYNTGPEILSHKGKLYSNYFKFFDYYLEQNSLRKIVYNKKLKKKIKILGSARYSKEWIKVINKIYNFKRKKIKSNLKKIGVFLTQDAQNFPKSHPIVKILLEQKRIELKFRNKPRDFMPNKFCKFNYDELDTSELVDWSDIIISVQTSALLEALLKNKQIIFLEHLVPKTYGNWIKKFNNVVNLTKKNKDLIKFINLNNLKNNNSLKYKKIVIGDEKKNILEGYVKFYKKLN